MKLNEILYETPEMSEEKLLEIINKYIPIMKSDTLDRIRQLHKEETNDAKVILKEYDIIQEKKSYLTKNQRDQLAGFVAMCMIQMTKGNE